MKKKILQMVLSVILVLGLVSGTAMATNVSQTSSYKTSESVKKLATPTVKATNDISGVKVSWGKVSGAKKYEVYRSTNKKSWTKLATTTAVNYTDKKATKGKTYYYAVKAVNGSQVSSYKASAQIRYLAAPTVKAANTTSGVKVSWGKVTGAKKYEVYRSTNKKSWTKLTATTAVSYTDKKATKGKTYYYMVKAVNGTQKSAYKASSAVCYLTTPTVKASKVNGGVKASWGKVTGAKKYEVYRKVSGGSWKKIKTTTGLNYTDKDVAGGKSYSYYVKAVNGSSKSSYKASKSIKITSAMVWIPQTGSKYHSYSGCSSMKDPKQVTLSEAQSLGFEACKRCH